MGWQFGQAIRHRASGRIFRFVCEERRYTFFGLGSGALGAWVYIPGEPRPRWVPLGSLEQA